MSVSHDAHIQGGESFEKTLLVLQRGARTAIVACGGSDVRAVTYAELVITMPAAGVPGSADLDAIIEASTRMAVAAGAEVGKAIFLVNPGSVSPRIGVSMIVDMQGDAHQNLDSARDDVAASVKIAILEFSNGAQDGLPEGRLRVKNLSAACVPTGLPVHTLTQADLGVGARLVRVDLSLELTPATSKSGSDDIDAPNDDFDRLESLGERSVS